MELLRDLSPFLADALVILGVFVMTAGVYGLVRMPDVYTKVHAASKAVFLGAIALMAASLITLDAAIVLRLVLIAFALLITTPIASHAIVKAAAERGEPMQSPGATNESRYDLQAPAPTDEKLGSRRGFRNQFRFGDSSTIRPARQQGEEGVK
ncbi:monovalent cation/H(+) antiporter subunit G [soil metagenome]